MRKQRTLYLLAGLLLLAASKWLQFQYGSLWGDLLILPAAVFFVLALLLYMPQYQPFLAQAKQRRSAKTLAGTICAAVVSFQLFTMMTFGWGNGWGVVFVPLFLLLAGLSIAQWRALSKHS